MAEPHFSAGSALVVAAGTAGAAFTVAAAEKAALAFFGVPLAAVTAAFTGALVPMLFMDERPSRAFRYYAGSVAFSLVLTAVVLLAADLDPKWSIGVAGGLAAFARDLFAAFRNEVPPLIGAVRARLVGRTDSKPEGSK